MTTNRYMIERMKHGSKDFYFMRIVEATRMFSALAQVSGEFLPGDAARVTLLSVSLTAICDPNFGDGWKIP